MSRVGNAQMHWSSSLWRVGAGLALTAAMVAVPFLEGGASSGAAGTPGVASGAGANNAVSPGATSGLSPFTSVIGKVYMSLTGIGTITPDGGPIYVTKKTSKSTVEAAYLLATATDATVGNTTVTFDGHLLSFTPTRNVVDNFDAQSNWTNVTTIVAPVVDAAPTGLVKFTVVENVTHTESITGEILAVVMNDPTLTTDNTVSFLFGALPTTGGTFSIGLASPLNLSTPTLALVMSIGDSYGFQPGGQFSQITVNGKRMTSDAGGMDDSTCKYKTPHNWEACGNGALITVGGIGDSTTDPANPTATTATCPTPPGNPRCTDELYTLLPFVKTGTTSIKVHTLNPSANDNIFFSAFELDHVSAVIGAGALLTPVTGTSPLNAPFQFTAKVQNATGTPIAAQALTFKVLTGPQAGQMQTGTTNATGVATFTVTSAVTGTDAVQVSFKNTTGVTVASNVATVTFTSASTRGYRLDGSDGGVFDFGGATFHGSNCGPGKFGANCGLALPEPVVGMAPSPDAGGYWLVASGGGVSIYGDAKSHGGATALTLDAPIVGMAVTPAGTGYWLAGADGGVFAYGTAQYLGGMAGKHLDAPIVGLAVTPAGTGYWLAGADGGVFAFGTAVYQGSMGGKRLNATVVGIASTGAGTGYWLAGADGGVFAFGTAKYQGAMANKPLDAPVVGIAATGLGTSYWLGGADGGVFAFGSAKFAGSMAGKPLNRPIVGISAA